MLGPCSRQGDAVRRQKHTSSDLHRHQAAAPLFLKNTSGWGGLLIPALGVRFFLVNLLPGLWHTFRLSSVTTPAVRSDVIYPHHIDRKLWPEVRLLPIPNCDWRNAPSRSVAIAVSLTRANVSPRTVCQVTSGPAPSFVSQLYYMEGTTERPAGSTRPRHGCTRTPVHRASYCLVILSPPQTSMMPCGIHQAKSASTQSISLSWPDPRARPPFL